MVTEAEGSTALTLSLEQHASRVFLDSTLMMLLLVQPETEKIENKKQMQKPCKETS